MTRGALQRGCRPHSPSIEITLSCANLPNFHPFHAFLIAAYWPGLKFLSLRNSMQTNESNGMLQATFCFSDTAKHRQTPRNAAGTALPSTIPSGSKLASAAVRVFSKMDAISFNSSPTNTTRETSSPAFSRASRASAASLLVDEILGQVRNRLRHELPDPFAGHQCLDDL
jgi:hypothetical protein